MSITHSYDHDELILRYACEVGDLKTVKVLCAIHRANFHIYEDLPLRLAAAFGHLGIVKYLVEDCSAIYLAKNCDALIQAVVRGHLDIVKYLCKKGYFCSIGNDLFMIAIIKGHLEIVRLFIKTEVITIELLKIAIIAKQFEIFKLMMDNLDEKIDVSELLKTVTDERIFEYLKFYEEFKNNF
jgi:hypothetical protein